MSLFITFIYILLYYIFSFILVTLSSSAWVHLWSEFVLLHPMSHSCSSLCPFSLLMILCHFGHKCTLAVERMLKFLILNTSFMFFCFYGNSYKVLLPNSYYVLFGAINVNTKRKNIYIDKILPYRYLRPACLQQLPLHLTHRDL